MAMRYWESIQKEILIQNIVIGNIITICDHLAEFSQCTTRSTPTHNLPTPNIYLTSTTYSPKNKSSNPTPKNPITISSSTPGPEDTIPTTTLQICWFSTNRSSSITRGRTNLWKMTCWISCIMDTLLKILWCLMKRMNSMRLEKIYPGAGAISPPITIKICSPPVVKIMMSLPEIPHSHLSVTRTTSSTSKPTNLSCAMKSIMAKSRKNTSKDLCWAKNKSQRTEETVKTKWTYKIHHSSNNHPFIQTRATRYLRTTTHSTWHQSHTKI